MDNATLNTLKQLIGIPSMYNIEFKVSHKPIELDGKLFNGMCTDTDTGFLIEYEESSESVITVLHELGHVLEFLNDERQDCDRCERMAQLIYSQYFVV